jgi:hypothetical protein
MSEPRSRDPVALLLVGGAALLAVVAAGFLTYSLMQDFAAPRSEKPASVIPQAPRTLVTEVPLERVVPSELLAAHGVGRAWRYRVTVEPALWNDATLVYAMLESDGAKVVNARFGHAAGQMSFQLGTFAAGHPSHANTRFPGFFMYAAYLDRPLELGRRYAWEWPWQLPGGEVRAGRVKRYVGEVVEWGSLPAPLSAEAPGNTFVTWRIDGTLSYIEDGTVRASASETLWYAPRYLQVVRVVREGKTPDEGAHRIVADLVEYRD